MRSLARQASRTTMPSTPIAPSASRRSPGPMRSGPIISRRANATVAHNRSLLPERFNNLPQYRAEVVREPSFSEVAGGAAHAAPPSPDGSRPGRVYVHLLGKHRGSGAADRPDVP